MQVLARMRLPVVPVNPDDVARKADLIEGEGVHYSLEPTDTGARWIDGQPVFRRVFIGVSGTAADANHNLIAVPGGWGFFGLIRLDGYLTTDAGLRIPMASWFAANDYFSIRINAGGDIIERHGGADKNSRPVIVILDYISQPTGGSSWDQGTAAWDDGTSTWDQHTGQIAPLWDGGGSEWDNFRRLQNG